MTKLILVFFLTTFFCNISISQIVINEISNKNSGQITDEDGEYNDWIELYNTSASAINLAGYYLSDDSLNLEKWAIPSYKMEPSDHLVIFASGKNKTATPANFHWESAVMHSHNFDYIVPADTTPANWMMPQFTPTGWKQGKAGFGFGDNDDATNLPSLSMTVYVRKSFILPAGFTYKELALHVDYDDGFVAYLNGTEIARKGINGTPTWNSSATGPREAMLYLGGKPENIALDTAIVRSLLVEGENVFAIEVHNFPATPYDLSLIPFFSFKVSNKSSFFDKAPLGIISLNMVNLHTNFKINSKGEKIYLYHLPGNKVETVWVKDMEGGWSLGRVSDGAEQTGIFIQPTPSMPNTTQTYINEREPAPLISVAEGYYTTSQKISLSTSSATAQIRYTTNGEEPKITSNLYNGTSITVSSSGIVRAACFSKTNKLPSTTVTNTYFINNTGHTVPVFSVITDTTNLYGDTGIFDHYNMQWERPCYVEYFDVDKTKLFEQSSGIQIDGGAGGSRSHAQHSFRLEFDNNVFGEGDVDEVLIPDRPDRNDYKSVYLRNGSNQYLNFQFKDAMETKMMSFNTLNYYSACTPVVAYINGAYFGLYELREKLNEEFFKENYNATIDSSFHLLSLSYFYNSVLRALNGSVDTFMTDYVSFLKLNQSDPEYLSNADKIIDLDYYTDYIIAESWIANIDWPQNNIKIVKGDFTNHRWRFILLDLEDALLPIGTSPTNLDHISYMLNYSPRLPYLHFWQELMKDPTYKKYFINRFADIMNTSYLPVNTNAITQSIYNTSLPEMRAEYVKWGGGEIYANNNMIRYSDNLSIFKSKLNNRTAAVRSNIIKNFALKGKYSLTLKVQPAASGVIQLNTIIPQEYPWTGTYFAGVPIKIEARGTGNYIFDSWEPNRFIKDVNNPVIETDIDIMGPNFIARFKLKVPEQAITISEVNYVSGDVYPASDWVELHNYGQNTLDLTDWYITDSEATHKWVFPGSVILPSNERLVLASNITKFIAVYPNVKNVIGSFEFGLGTPTDQVYIYNSNHQLIAAMEYNSQAPWPTGAFDMGMTLELKDPNRNLSDASNWFEGCVGGSPGLAYKDCNTGIMAFVDNTKPTIYPNPVTDKVNIVMPSGICEQKITCTILNTMGKQVKTLNVQYSGEKNIAVPVAEISKGVYIVHINYGNIYETLKFVKQ